MTVLYPNLCYAEMCYDGTALFISVRNESLYKRYGLRGQKGPGLR